MIGYSRLRVVAVALAFSGFWAIGCHGGGMQASRDKSRFASKSPGPALGNPSGGSLAHRDARTASNSEARSDRTIPSAGMSRSQPKPQLTCPVDGKALGISGAPVATTLKGEPVFVCSQACQKKAQQNPDKYLAKVRTETAARE